jgi:hypothetical protein
MGKKYCERKTVKKMQNICKVNTQKHEKQEVNYNEC